MTAPAPLPPGTATERCETALLAALAKNPVDRPASARAFSRVAARGMTRRTASRVPTG